MKRKISFLQAIIMIGCIPLIAAIIILTLYSATKIKTELINSTYSRLKACSTSVEQYFTWDIREGILERDDVSYSFIDSLKDDQIEMTFFENDVRFISSIIDENGNRAEGTKADPEVWETIQAGQDYRSDDVTIQGDKYYVYYKPVRADDGTVIGIAFSGEKTTTVNQTISGMLKNLFIISGLLILFFTGILVFLALKIRKPLMNTSEYIGRIANGDLTEQMTTASVITEIQTLLQSSSTLQQKLSDIVTNIDGHANQLDTSIDSLNTLAEASSDGAGQIRKAMDELSGSAVTLAEDVQTANERIMEMGDHITTIGSETASLHDNSAKMDSAGREATDSMNIVLSSSKTSSDIIADVITQVQETNQAVAAINEAVDLISGITAQTNLLSLNASIEAARAGQAGKGFAVVASEIKQLADQSSHGAETIKNIVADILLKSNESVALTTRVKSLVDQEQQNISSAKSNFDTLNAIIKANVGIVETIDEKTKQLEALKKEIIDSISSLSAISQENAASNEEVTASVSNIAESIEQISEDTQLIRNVSTDLSELMKYFK